MQLDTYLSNSCPVGTRNTSLFAAVAAARQANWPEERIRAELGAKAARNGLPKCEISATISAALACPLPDAY
jgi:hypothetical protein